MAGMEGMVAYAVTYGEAYAQQNAYCVEWSENKKVAQARRANRQAERDRAAAARAQTHMSHNDSLRCQSCINRGYGCNGGIPNCGAYRSRMAK